MTCPPGGQHRTAVSRAGARGRSCSSNACERSHRHSGCYACSRRSASAERRFHTQGRQEYREGVDDLRELTVSLENEISEASQQFPTQVKRIVGEAEQSARALRVGEAEQSA